MKTSTRKRLGAALLVISPLVGLAFYFSGTPLLTLQESYTSSFPGGTVTAAHYKLHWPLLAVCASASFGLIALAWPQQKPPRLQP